MSTLGFDASAVQRTLSPSQATAAATFRAIADNRGGLGSPHLTGASGSSPSSSHFPRLGGLGASRRPSAIGLPALDEGFASFRELVAKFTASLIEEHERVVLESRHTAEALKAENLRLSDLVAAGHEREQQLSAQLELASKQTVEQHSQLAAQAQRQSDRHFANLQEHRHALRSSQSALSYGSPGVASYSGVGFSGIGSNAILTHPAFGGYGDTLVSALECSAGSAARAASYRRPEEPSHGPVGSPASSSVGRSCSDAGADRAAAAASLLPADNVEPLAQLPKEPVLNHFPGGWPVPDIRGAGGSEGMSGSSRRRHPLAF
eukprot:TRINITY_DN32744_c0_g1_i1.p1 TRINITY_DN32744_c0_g1~~TRINITY_DN32744_c0_g1_i1.p1  ORF type:complete len:320 (+),score=56.93 TRINITY_DN32744_c0_g1_i1:91-1050(+)